MWCTYVYEGKTLIKKKITPKKQNVILTVYGMLGQGHKSFYQWNKQNDSVLTTNSRSGDMLTVLAELSMFNQ